jgi:hypothetical protein
VARMGERRGVYRVLVGRAKGSKLDGGQAYDRSSVSAAVISLGSMY